MFRKRTTPFSGPPPLAAGSRTILLASIAAGLLAGAIAILCWAGQGYRGPVDAFGTTGSSATPKAPETTEEKPYLGITYVPITPHMAAYYGLPVDSGSLVTAVASGSPAHKAGIQPDDVIVSLDGQKLDGEVTMLELLNRRAVGDRMEIGVIRQGGQCRLEVVLVSRPGS